MLFHVRGIADPIEQARAARQFILDLAESPMLPDDRRAAIVAEANYVGSKPDVYIVHEYLEPHNQAIYFWEFAERCARHGLQYLGDALHNVMTPEENWSVSRRWLDACGDDIVRAEQYCDFLRGRTFRRALICRRRLSLDRTQMTARARDLYVSSYLRQWAQGGGYSRFEHAGGTWFSTNHPDTRTALSTLTQRFPEAVRVAELMDGARDPQQVASDIVRCAQSGMAELFVAPPPLCAAPTGPRPRISAIARYLAGFDHWLVNLRHEAIEVDAVNRRVATALDGTRAAEEVAAQLQLSIDDVRDAITALAKGGFVEA
jgi:methyltransferase-like protein